MTDLAAESQTDRIVHAYTSTACHHGLHGRCRLTCKFCPALCRCECHDDPGWKRTVAPDLPATNLVGRLLAAAREYMQDDAPMLVDAYIKRGTVSWRDRELAEEKGDEWIKDTFIRRYGDLVVVALAFRVLDDPTLGGTP